MTGCTKLLGREKLESELGSKFRKLRPCKVLCEEVSWVFSALDKVEVDDLFFNELPDIMVSYVNVLRSALLYGIRPDEDRTLIISADRYCRDVNPQFP